MSDHPLHISARVSALLRADGWAVTGWTFKKRAPTGGQFGFQIMTLRIDETGRWFERVDGWGKVERDVDLRNYENDPAGAIKVVIN